MAQQDQVAVLTLSRIRYMAGPAPTQFSLTITAATDTTPLNINLTPGVEQTVDLIVGGTEVASNVAASIPVSVTVTGTGPGGPINGSYSTTYTINPSSNPQFIMTIPVMAGPAPAGQLVLTYTGARRALPFIVSVDWLCWYRYYFPIYYQWLCDGLILPAFNMMPPVTALSASVNLYAPKLQSVSNDLSLGYTFPGTGAPLVDRINFTFDVALAAPEQLSILPWRHRLAIEDYTVAVDAHMFDYIAWVYDLYFPSPRPLCKKWRELLNCFCRICARWNTLPIDIRNEYNASVAPEINNLYPIVVNLAQQEGVPYYFDPGIGDQCRKLRNIIAFFAYWCRRCIYSVPVSFDALEPSYLVLYPSLSVLNGMLVSAGLTICDPPEKDFCARWVDVIDCLKKLCLEKDQLSTSLRNSIESLFGTLVRNVYNYLFASRSSLPSYPAGLDNTCEIINDWLSDYFAYVCNTNSLAGGKTVRTQLDNYLLQFESAMASLISTYGDVCTNVPMTDCEEWDGLLDCLVELCNSKGVMPESMVDDFIDLFETPINGLYGVIPPANPPLAPPPAGPRGLDTICWKIGQIQSFLTSICPDGLVDPEVKAELDQRLPILQGLLNQLKATWPLVCTAGEFGTPDCNAWLAALNCLDIICDRVGRYDPSITTAFENQFTSVLHYLDWFRARPTTYYGGLGSATYDIDDLCGWIDSLISLVQFHCAVGEMYPVEKYRFDEVLAELQALIAAFQATYPGICDKDDPDCRDWLMIFSCLSRICRRVAAYETNIDLQNLMAEVEADFGVQVDDLYVDIYGAPPSGSFATSALRRCYEIHQIYDLLLRHCACGETTVLTSNPAPLSQITLFRTIYASFQPCACDCLTDEITLTTGYAPWNVTASVNGGTFPRAANVLLSYGSMAAPLAGSHWISPISTASNSTTGDTTFEREFHVCGDTTVKISLKFWADDRVTIFLDSEQIGFTQLPGSGSIEIMRSVTSGMHKITAVANNNPGGNMGFSAVGYVEALCGNLRRDGSTCVMPTSPESALKLCICCGVGSECDTIWRLPYYAKVLCCDPFPTNDPEYPSAVIGSVTSLLSQHVPTLTRVILELGLDPADFPLNSSSFCEKYRHSLRVAMMGFLRFGSLPVILRFKLECFRRGLETHVGGYVNANPDLPYRCCDCFAGCEDWTFVLRQLCCYEENRLELMARAALGNYEAWVVPVVDELYDALKMIDAARPFPVFPLYPSATYRQRLRAIQLFLGSLCLWCDSTTTSVFEEIEENLVAIREGLLMLRDMVAPAPIDFCDDPCEEYIGPLDCLLMLALRRAELPSEVRTIMEAEFPVHITALHAAIPNVGNDPNPFPIDVVPDYLWRLTQVLRGLRGLCSPFIRIDATVARNLLAIRYAFRVDYKKLRDEMAFFHIDWCEKGPDACAQLRRIPEIISAFCINGPASSTSYMTSAESLLTLLVPDLASIKRQLGLPFVGYPIGGSFCDRLWSALTHTAIVLSRRDRLTRRYGATVDFFYYVLSSLATSYINSVGASRPTPRNAMTEYRGNWMKLLGCVCEACALVGSLTAAEKNNPSYAPALAQLAPGGQVFVHVTALYHHVIALAGQKGMPIVFPRCLAEEDICGKLRVILSFFALWCALCTEPDAATVGPLQGFMTALGNAVTLMRKLFRDVGRTLCPDEQATSADVQSPWLYLQAAGSDGADGTVPGVHLRWAFTRDLDKHLPKGNLSVTVPEFSSTEWLNRGDDFVRVYRSAYGQQYRVSVDLAESHTVSGLTWTYDNQEPDPSDAGTKRSLVIQFEDAAEYNRVIGVLGTGSPTSNPSGFIAEYNGVFDVQVGTGRLPFFSLELTVNAAGGSPTTKVEGVLLDESPSGPVELLSCRRSFTGSGAPHRLESEGMLYARVQTDNVSITTIAIETYEDYYLGTKRRYGWEYVGEFALTTSDTEAEQRLRVPGATIPVDGNWPRFNLDPNEDAGKVVVANYLDRWLPNPNVAGRQPSEGLKTLVTEYLKGSRTKDSWEALFRLDSKTMRPGDPSKPDQTIEISLLRMVQLVAQDYHVARMVGLGHVDASVPLTTLGHPASQRYVYMIEYVTTTDAIGTPRAPFTHRYLSLPTGRSDARLPVGATFSSHYFGVPPISPDAAGFTDADGYTYDGESRFIRFHKNDVVFDVPRGTFFSGGEFCRGTSTRPVLYGVKYRDQAEVNWRLEEPSNDLGFFPETPGTYYKDAENIPEVVPIPDGKNPILILQLHRSEDKGKHYTYRLYSINWFARTSPDGQNYGPIVNEFPKKNTLLPPSNLTGLLIQNEPSALLNSPFEQSNISAGLNLENKSRVTFDWNHVHNTAYECDPADCARWVRFLFRKDPPSSIRGEVLSTLSLGEKEVRVWVKAFEDPSRNDPAGGALVIEPLFDGPASKYVGGVFATNDFRFRVLEVTSQVVNVNGVNKTYAVFRLEKVFIPKGTDPETLQRLKLGSDNQWVMPPVGQRFNVVENLGRLDTWKALDGTDLPIVRFSLPGSPGVEHSETETDDQGITVIKRVGGIYLANAQITEFFEDQVGSPGVPDLNKPLGAYKIVFPGYTLTAPATMMGGNAPGPNVERVEWFGGVARVTVTTTPKTEKRMLQVGRIELVQNPPNPTDPHSYVSPLTIYILDPAARDTAYGTSQGRIIPRDGAMHVRAVNYHPSYRVYLDLEATTEVTLTTDVLPQGPPTDNGVVRQTYISACSYQPGVQPTDPPVHTSAPAPPAAHVARDIRPPVVPAAPVGPAYSTRPDYYGKSSYTFDVAVDPNDPPYAMIFGRADERMILRALYTEAKITEIMNWLPDRENDANFDQRWRDLVDVQLTGSSFKTYGDGVPAFPNPNKEEPYDPDNPSPFKLFDGNHTPDTITDLIKRAIDEAFLPLNDRPVIYELIRSDTLETSNVKPVLFTTDGTPLAPDDPEFNPFPMIRRGTTSISGAPQYVVRFTDFTLDGASRNFYFYTARGMSTLMAMSGLSAVLGPVQTIDAYPPKAPEIRFVKATPANPAFQESPRVTIGLNPYPESDRVRKARIYRSYSPDIAKNVQSMDAILTVDIPAVNPVDLDAVLAAYTVEDRFIAEPPQTDVPIFYRVSVLRAVSAKGVSELVESAPSDVVVVSIPDVGVPTQPTLTVASHDEPDPETWDQIVLQWNQTVRSGTYELYELTTSGTWRLITTKGPNGLPAFNLPITHSIGMRKVADGSKTLYNHFKVVAQNSSGLVSADKRILTIPTP